MKMSRFGSRGQAAELGAAIAVELRGVRGQDLSSLTTLRSAGAR